MSALTVSVTVALLVVLCVNVQESVQMTVEQPNGKADISSFIEENLGSAGDGLNEMISSLCSSEYTQTLNLIKSKVAELKKTLSGADSRFFGLLPILAVIVSQIMYSMTF